MDGRVYRSMSTTPSTDSRGDFPRMFPWRLSVVSPSCFRNLGRSCQESAPIVHVNKAVAVLEQGGLMWRNISNLQCMMMIIMIMIVVVTFIIPVQ